MTKFLLAALLYLALFFCCAWLFNHVNVWMGIFATIAVVASLILLLTNHLKN